MLNSLNDTCTCPVPCKQLRYYPNLSYTHLSKLNIERMVLLEDGEKEQVKTEFQHARETLQRVKEEIRNRDGREMTKIVNLGETLELLLSDSDTIYANFSSFSEQYGVMDILGEASNYIEHDYNYFHSKFEDAASKTQNVYPYTEFKYPWMSIDYLTPIVNGSYVFFDRFTECMAGGLDLTNDTEAHIIATSVAPEVDNSTAYDNDTTTTAPSGDEDSSRWDAHGNPRYPSYSDYNSYYIYPRIFADQSCDSEIYFQHRYRYYSTAYYRSDLRRSGEDIKTWYESLTSIMPEAIVEAKPEHQKCISILTWLNTTGQQTMNTYYDLLDELSSSMEGVLHSNGIDGKSANFTESVQNSYNITSAINDLLNSLEMGIILEMIETPHLERDSNWNVVMPESFPEGNNTQVCLWLYRDLIGIEQLGENSELLHMYHNSDHEKFIDTFEKFAESLTATKLLFDTKVKPVVTKFTHYLDGTITKLDLVRGVVNPRSSKNIEDFTDKIDELDKIMEELDEAIEKESENGLQLLEIPITLPTPFIDYHSMNDTITGQQLEKMKNNPVTGYDDEDMKTNFQQKFIERQRYHYDRIKQILGNLHVYLIDSHEDFLEDFDEEREVLRTYRTSVQMDDEFYM